MCARTLPPTRTQNNAELAADLKALEEQRDDMVSQVARVGACVEVEIDGGEKDSGAVEEIDVKKYSFLCSFYKFID